MMTQNFIQPKGSLKTQVDTSNLQSQLAQMFADRQLQGQAQAQSEAVDPMRQTVNDLLKNKLMQNIEMPKYTTIQDIFNAPKGEKLNTFGSYLNTPNGQNVLGGLLSLFSGGKYFTTPSDPYNQYLQQDMNTKQAQAMSQLKEQNDIATSMNSAFLQQDIAEMNDKRARELAKEEFEWKKQQNDLDRALEREKMANSLKIAGIVHSGRGGATGGASGLRLTPTQINSVRNEFKRDKAIKDYDLINAKTQDINAIKQKFKGTGRLNATDQALIMNFNKTLDPISVVRESEFARTAAGQSIIDRAEGAMIKIARGGSGLSKAERDSIYQVFDVMQDSAKNRAKTVAQEYFDLSERYGVNPKDIIMQYSSLLEEPTLNQNDVQQVGKYKVRIKQ